ncbi:Enoyl-CoA hydratase [Phytophthora palmivora]|uniref:Enoyl-CoA hydratase n=1 Tax=Phytophthora palmivora TaxID=4796 RepID=A0A2P4X785_9STRA|nr:Enoyl-CoA hydratase [Phytophthora palmivora]
MTVKKGDSPTTEKVSSNQDEDRTPAEAAAFDSHLEKAIKEADEIEYKEAVPASESSKNEAPITSMDIDDEGLGTQ